MKEAGVLSHSRLVCQGHGEPLNICVQPQTLAKRAESHSKSESFFFSSQIQTLTPRSLSLSHVNGVESVLIISGNVFISPCSWNDRSHKVELMGLRTNGTTNNKRSGTCQEHVSYVGPLYLLYLQHGVLSRVRSVHCSTLNFWTFGYLCTVFSHTSECKRTLCSSILRRSTHILSPRRKRWKCVTPLVWFFVRFHSLQLLLVVAFRCVYAGWCSPATILQIHMKLNMFLFLLNRRPSIWGEALIF